MSGAGRLMAVLAEAAVAIPAALKLTARLMADRRVPGRYRALAAAAAGYTLVPLDVIPDWIPVVGRVDDILVAAIALHILVEGAGMEIVSEHWDGSDRALEVFDEVLLLGFALVPWPLRVLVNRVVANQEVRR